MVSVTSQRILPGQQLSQSKKKVDGSAARQVESLSSDDESNGSSASSFFGENALYTESQNNDHASSKSTVSKKILDRFLKGSAGASSVKEAIELHKKIMESDDDSSSTGTDFGQVWGLPVGESHYTDNAPDNRSSTEGHNIDSDSDIGSGDDSSIEILNRSQQRPEIHSSPVGRGMNGRHLSGRQRRLEAARSKNSVTQFFGENGRGDISSTEDNGYSSDDMDIALSHAGVDGNDDYSGHDIFSVKETSRTVSKSSASVRTETEECDNDCVEASASSTDAQVPASQLRGNIPSGPRSAISTSEIQNIEAPSSNDIGVSNNTGTNCIGATETTQNDSGRLGGDTKASENQPTKKVSKQTKKTVQRKESTARSNSRKKVESILASGVFDNLFSNGKDFFAWARITDPNDFLRHSKDYAPRVNEWRKERKLPLFNDTKGYIQKLRKQIRDNMKSIASKSKKHSNHASTIGRKRLKAVSKSEKRREKKRRSIYPSMKDMPMEGNDFMTHMGIKNIEDIFKRNDLHQHVNEWRKEQKLPLLDNEYSCLATWRKWVRQNMKPSEDSVKETPPDEIDFSNCMKIVSSLSKRFLNGESGLPVYQFAVYDTLSTGT